MAKQSRQVRSESKSAVTTERPTAGDVPTTCNRAEVRQLAYSYWQARGCPYGSAEEDWFRAEHQLNSSAVPNSTLESDSAKQMAASN